ncbi:MAG: tyrosine phosphatase family protein [Rhizobiaceae bacterium]
MIHVSPRSRLEATLAACRAERLITLLREGSDFVRPDIIEAPNFLLLSMHDIVEEREGMTAPAAHHVEALIAFAEAWDRKRPLAINCYAGISRSTAAAYVIACALAPSRDEGELAATLRRLSPSATPNIRLVTLADDILGRSGRMTKSIRGIGRGAEAFEGEPFVLEIDALAENDFSRKL